MFWYEKAINSKSLSNSPLVWVDLFSKDKKSLLFSDRSLLSISFFFPPKPTQPWLSLQKTPKATRKHGYIRALNYKSTRIPRAKFPIQAPRHPATALTCHLTAEPWCCTSQHSLNISPAVKICLRSLPDNGIMKFKKRGEKSTGQRYLKDLPALVMRGCSSLILVINKQLSIFVHFVCAYLLPQSKALQPDSHSFGSQYRCGEVHFNFGLVFTHDT